MSDLNALDLSASASASAFSHPQVSVVQSRRSSDKTLFIRTQGAIYFSSLLLCNLIQSTGGLVNIAWIVRGGVHASAACTAQAALKQIGNVREMFALKRETEYSHVSWSQIGAAVFALVIAVHTFSLLFLRRQYSDRTCYITFTLSWSFVLFELCVDNFILSKPKEGRPIYGPSGYWCWITPMHQTAQYATTYLFMFVSASCSFILYSLVFFRHRGNISVSSGYRISFHRRPKVRAGRTSDGTCISTDDRRIESHLTALAKHLLWYPIAYILIVLPMAASRFSTFAKVSVPFPVVIFTASLFVLHGFFNMVLFCTTRVLLPGNWRQRFGLSYTRGTKGGDVDPSSRTNNTWFTATRNGTVGTGTTTGVLSIDVEKNVEVTCKAQASTYVKFSSPTSSITHTSPAPPLKAYGGQRVDAREHHIQRLSSSVPQDTSTGVRFELDEDDWDSEFDVGGHLAGNSRTVEWEVPQHRGRAFSERENGTCRPALA